MTQVSTCTAQLRHGKFCDLPGAEDMPFPICDRHARQVWGAVAGHLRAQATALAMGELADRDAPSCVYYVRMDGHVKIGTTVALGRRLRQLKAHPEDVLAVEYGDYTLERQRHAQFDSDRVDPRREFFRMSDTLCEHIERIAEHDAPIREMHLTI